MTKQTLFCASCDQKFERVVIEQGEEPRCPRCGDKKVTLIDEGEKKPMDCGCANKFK